MRSTPSLRTLLLLLALVPALPARADTVAVHPCVTSGIKDRAQSERLQSACREELERFELLLTPSQSQVATLLAKAKGGTCAYPKEPERLKCLGQLAAATQASMALLVTIAPDRELFGFTTVSLLLADAEGTYVEAGRQALATPENPQPPLEDLLRLKMRRLRTELLNLQRITAPARPAPPEPAPPATADSSLPPTGQAQASTHASAGAQAQSGPQAQATPQPLPEQASPAAPALATAPAGSSPWSTWRKPATYASLGAGALAGGVALVLALQSEGNMRQAIGGFNAAAQGQQGGVPVFPSESALQEQVGRYHQLALDQRLAAGLSTGLSAALLGVGAWLWLTEPAPPAPGTASLTVGPGSLGVRVLTP